MTKRLKDWGYTSLSNWVISTYQERRSVVPVAHLR